MTVSENIYTNGRYLKTAPTWHVEDSPWKAGQILKIIKKNRLNPTTICEIGCGAGEILHQLSLKMPEYVSFFGYEISPQAFNLCQTKKNERLEFHLQDLINVDVKPFDILLCIDVLEHVEDYFNFLRKLRQKGKYKIFHIPLDLSVQMVLRMRPIIRARRNVGHIHYFTKETAIEILKDTGYRIIDTIYTPASIDRPNSFKAKLAKYPRWIFYRIHKDLTVRILGGYSLMVLAR